MSSRLPCLPPNHERTLDGSVILNFPAVDFVVLIEKPPPFELRSAQAAEQLFAVLLEVRHNLLQVVP